MSRIGKKAIAVPKGVSISIDGQSVTAKGPKGELNFVVNDLCTVALADDEVSVTPIDKSKAARSQWGMNRTMIANMVDGVSNAFTKRLDVGRDLCFLCGVSVVGAGRRPRDGHPANQIAQRVGMSGKSLVDLLFADRIARLHTHV